MQHSQNIDWTRLCTFDFDTPNGDFCVKIIIPGDIPAHRPTDTFLKIDLFEIAAYRYIKEKSAYMIFARRKKCGGVICFHSDSKFAISINPLTFS